MALGAVFLPSADVPSPQPPAPKPAGEDLRTETFFFPAKIGGVEYRLEAKVYRPNDNKRHALVIMNHGRLGLRPERDPKTVLQLQQLNRALAEHGYVTMMLVRRGYGNSDGPDCELKETAGESGLEAAKDVRAALEYMHTKDYVLEDCVVIAGVSQGGWTSLACATLPLKGVRGVVNLCGGVAYAGMGASGRVTQEVQDRWARACGKYGRSTKVPSLWIYSENDVNHASAAVHRMFTTYQKNGGKGTLLIKPPYRGNGHSIAQNPSLFFDDLLAFFATIGVADTEPSAQVPAGVSEKEQSSA